MRSFVKRLGLLAPALSITLAHSAPGPDYSKEPLVIQDFSKQIAFAADGAWQAEQSAAVRIQSEAGVRQFGVLSFSYKADNESLEVTYVRVRKPDGSVIETSATTSRTSRLRSPASRPLTATCAKSRFLLRL